MQVCKAVRRSNSEELCTCVAARAEPFASQIRQEE